MTPRLHIIAPTTETQLRAVFAEERRLAGQQRVNAAEIARLRRIYADENGLITPPRIELLRGRML